MEGLARDLAVQYAVTDVLASATTLGGATRAILPEICRILGWHAAAVWLADQEAGALRCAASWTSGDDDLAGVNAGRTFPPGIGMPGRVWSRGEPLWIRDVTADTNFPRIRWAERAGVHGAFATPITAHAETIGVLELFHTETVESDPALEQLFAAVGAQIGLAIERLRAREQLAASESRVRAIVDGASEAVIGIDQNGRIIEWNRQAELLFGFRREEVLQRALAATIIPERYRERHRSGLARFTRTGEGPFIGRRIEIEALRRDGREIPIEITITPVQTPDGYVFSAFVRDIGERRRYEDRLRFLAEASTVLSESLDFETTLSRIAQLALAAVADVCVIHLLDDQGAKLHRVLATSPDPELDRRWRELSVSSELDLDSEHPVAASFRERKTVFFDAVGESEIATLGHSAAHAEFLRSLGLLQWLCVPLIGHGDALGAMSFAVSRVERRWSEADVALAEEIARRAAVAVDNAKLYRQAREAVRTRDEFLSTVSHDLRNPLASIKGLAQLLQRRAQRLATAETLGFVESLARIDAAATRMTTLLDELVEVSGMRIGQPLELAREPVDLVALAREAVGNVRSDGHTVEIDARESTVVANGDPARLQRVLMNLIANAVKYSEGGNISVRVGREDAAAIIAVSDHGRGIPAADLPFIFDRFRRGSNVEGISGSGIGLTAAKQIVELHGGTIDVESAEGVGSTFTVRLPL